MDGLLATLIDIGQERNTKDIHDDFAKALIKYIKLVHLHYDVAFKFNRASV